MYIEFCTPSPKAGQREHVSHTTAIALITAGLAREVILTDAEKKALRFGVKPFVLPEPEWTIILHQNTGRVHVQRKHMSDTHLFDGVPDLNRWPDLKPERAKALVKEFAAMVAKQEAQGRANDIERAARGR